ncbi:GNAT family N-acetyltransferase [soil metagenome]|jgi:ribosomal-protein-alanine N-acetyltransferase
MELKGKGFTLRGWKTTDAEALQKHADNTHISDFLLDRFPSPYTLDDAVNWITLMQNQDPMVNFVIAIDDSLVGVIGLEFREDVYRKTALLGYWLSEARWGRGIMPQAVKLITAYAFANLDVLRIQAGVLSSNSKSMRVLEKAGYVKEGVMKNAIIKNGVVLDEHIYAMCPPTP